MTQCPECKYELNKIEAQMSTTCPQCGVPTEKGRAKQEEKERVDKEETARLEAKKTERIEKRKVLQSKVTNGVTSMLSDQGFDRFVTPAYIKVIWYVMIALAAFNTLGCIIMAFVQLGVLSGFLCSIIIPIAAAIYLFLVRMFLESVMVLFSINSNLRNICEIIESKSSQSGTSSDNT